MKNGNTIFFILFTANFIVAILSACAYIFSWTLLIPFILLTIVVGGLNCAILKSPKQNAICFMPTIVSAIATSIAGVTINFDYFNVLKQSNSHFAVYGIHFNHSKIQGNSQGLSTSKINTNYNYDSAFFAEYLLGALLLD